MRNLVLIALILCIATVLHGAPLSGSCTLGEPSASQLLADGFVGPTVTLAHHRAWRFRCCVSGLVVRQVGCITPNGATAPSFVQLWEVPAGQSGSSGSTKLCEVTPPLGTGWRWSNLATPITLKYDREYILSVYGTGYYIHAGPTVPVAYRPGVGGGEVIQWMSGWSNAYYPAQNAPPDAEYPTKTMGMADIGFDDEPVFRTANPLPAITAGATYYKQFVASQGHPPYMYSASGLPSGWNLATDGLLHATAGVVVQGNYSFDVTVTDSQLHATTITFSIVVGAYVNYAPQLSVGTSPAPGVISLLPNHTLHANYGDSLVSLLPAIAIYDLNGDNCSINATISNTGSSGLLASEFSVGSQPSPFILMPGTGTLNNPSGVIHQVDLVASDGVNLVYYTFYIDQAPRPILPEMRVHDGAIAGPVISNGAAAANGRDFGTRDIAFGASAATTIVIVNIGSADLALANPAASGDVADFVLNTSVMQNVVPAGQSTSFEVSFDPMSTGAKSATITFTHNDPWAWTGSPFTFQVAGIGTAPGALSITTATVLDATADYIYAPVQLAANGGYPAYVWRVSAGALPAGLTLSGTGVISGIVNAAPGVYAFTAEVRDQQGNTVIAGYSIQVSPPGAGGDGAGGGSCSTNEGCSLLLLLLLMAMTAKLARRRA